MSSNDEMRAVQRARASQNRAALDDEYRVCTRCGWQIKKSQAIAQGVKKCPRCGGEECYGQTLPFNFDPNA